MTTIDFGLNIDAQGTGTTIAELKKIEAAIAGMRSQAAKLNQLAKTLGVSEDAAAKLAKSFGKSTDEMLELIRTLNQLKSVGATASQRLNTLQKSTGLTTAQFQKLEQQLAKTQDELDEVNEAASGFEKLGGAIAAAGITAKITQIGQSTLQTGLKFEQLQAQLVQTLGSESAADQVFGRLQTFAATTPNQLDEVIQAFISLRQRGIEPTNDVLQRAGDIAASQGKPLQQYIEAILDATTGENERLKEFGIVARQSGEQVAFSFQGITKTVEKTPEAISEALLAFGELETVAGGMERRSQTLGGQFSNFQDNTEALSNELFELAQGPMIEVVSAANDLINGFRELPDPIRKTLLASAGFTGAFIAATAAVTAFNLANGKAIVSTTLESAALIKNAIATNAVAAGKLLAAAATGKLTVAQKASITAFTAQAATAGLVVGALAAVALAVDTYSKTTAAARDIQKETENLDKSLNTLIETEEKYAKTVDDTAKNLSLEAAALERTRKQLGPIQNALDVLRVTLNKLSIRGLLEEFAKLELVPEPIRQLISQLAAALPKFTTAAEESLKRQTVAFEEQADKADEIAGKVFDLFTRGPGELSDNEIKQYAQAVNEATTALKDHIPVDEQESDLKQQKLVLLEKATQRLDAETAARERNKTAIEETAEAEKQAIIDRAQAQAEATRDRRSTQQETQQEQFAEQNERRTEAFRLQQQASQEQFQETQRAAAEQHQEKLQANAEQFAEQLQERQTAFEELRQRDEEQFTKRQEERQKQFEEELQARRDRQSSAFQSATQQAARAEQLAAAETNKERGELRKEFARQDRQAEAIAKLQLANRDLSPSEILKLAKDVSGANLRTVEGAQKVQSAIAAIEEEQKRQQDAADLEARRQFELELLNEKKAFEEARLEQQKTFEEQQRELQKAFDAEQKAAQQAFAADQRALDKAFAEQERLAQKAFDDQQRTLQKAFAEEQRELDKANATQIAQILQAGKAAAGVKARRQGGPVSPGEPYLVGEEGPELIVPIRPGQVLTARQTAALIRPDPAPSFGAAPNRAIALNTLPLEQRLDRLIAQNRALSTELLRLSTRPVSQSTVNYYPSGAGRILRDVL